MRQPAWWLILAWCVLAIELVAARGSTTHMLDDIAGLGPATLENLCAPSSGGELLRLRCRRSAG